jgi:hypothetical protein
MLVAGQTETRGDLAAEEAQGKYILAEYWGEEEHYRSNDHHHGIYIEEWKISFGIRPLIQPHHLPHFHQLFLKKLIGVIATRKVCVSGVKALRALLGWSWAATANRKWKESAVVPLPSAAELVGQNISWANLTHLLKLFSSLFVKRGELEATTTATWDEKQSIQI